MLLTSPAFAYGGGIPREYTCDGSDVNPEFHIAEVPLEAKSLALILDDPDVPEEVRTDRMWVHWVVFNIPPLTRIISKNSQPEGTPGMNTGNQLKYQGPCPPDREHRYYFTLYALATFLDLPRGATKTDVLRAMQGHILATAEWMGRYTRVKS